MSKRMRSLLRLADKLEDILSDNPNWPTTRIDEVYNNAMQDWALHYGFLLKHGRYLEDEVA